MQYLFVCRSLCQNHNVYVFIARAAATYIIQTTVDVETFPVSSPCSRARMKGFNKSVVQKKCVDGELSSGAAVPSQPSSDLQYEVGDLPPWYIVVLYAFQQALATIRGPLSVVFLLHPTLCAQDDDALLGELMSSAIFMTGLATLLQATFGLRLPMVVASSLTFIPPVVAMMSTPRWQCPDDHLQNVTNGINITMNVTEAAWKPRLREVSGGLLAAACVQFLLGITGAMGFILNYIGPLTVAPTVALVGLSLTDGAIRGARHQWGIFALTIGLVVIFSLVLSKYEVPFPAWNKRERWHAVRYPIFKLFPYILAMGLSWLVCYILTITGRLPDDPAVLGYYTRTDARREVIEKARWFFFPYPCMYGTPTINAGIFLGMFAAIISTVIKSVGDSYGVAKVCRLPPPPKHCINRSIAVTGITNIVGALVGSGHATASWSSSIGFVGLTGMASRVTWQVAGAILILFGVVGKFGAAFALIPDPVIGAVTAMGLSLVVSVGLASIKAMNTKSSRNLTILGLAIFIGLIVPNYLKANPGIIDTGNSEADQVLTVFLGTAMFVGGVIGFALDNILPGSKKDRGIDAYLNQNELNNGGSTPKEYDLPLIKTSCLKQLHPCTFLPFMPSFNGSCSCKKTKPSAVYMSDSNDNHPGMDVCSQL